MKKDGQKMQSDYYSRTATQYDHSHIHPGKDEHSIALHFLSAIITMYSVETILDVGAGTGRTIEFVTKYHPEIKIIGIEPVSELREIGYKKGISSLQLMDGNGNNIHFNNGEFDLVCEFGVLHHVPKPSIMVSEMLRVANKYIFISDSNNFGQGTFISRTLKQSLRIFRLWNIYNFIRTKGKGYHITEGDGLFYSYSVFNNYKQISSYCKKIHLLNTSDGKYNFYKTASHVALFGIKL